MTIYFLYQNVRDCRIHLARHQYVPAKALRLDIRISLKMNIPADKMKIKPII